MPLTCCRAFRSSVSPVLLAIAVSAPLRQPQWSLLPGAFKGSVFLLALVWCASLMPVQHLPPPSWQTAFGLGFVSSVFDNIPLTALAIRQDGYDWGFLAYAVGFGGSMIWFGSSAGVALSNMYPEARSVFAWLKAGWHVALGYVVGFFVMLAAIGWHPHPIDARAAAPGAATPGVGDERALVRAGGAQDVRRCRRSSAPALRCRDQRRRRDLARSPS